MSNLPTRKRIQVGWRFDPEVLNSFRQACETDLRDPVLVLEFLMREYLKKEPIEERTLDHDAIARIKRKPTQGSK